MNSVSLIGRLTRDPELRYTQTGKAIARVTLAVNSPFKDSNGERQTDFINCTIWGKQAENTANFLRKGSQAGVTGRITTGSYENAEKQRIYTTEVNVDSVQFLDSKPKEQQSHNYQNSTPPGQEQYSQSGGRR